VESVQSVAGLLANEDNVTAHPPKTASLPDAPAGVGEAPRSWGRGPARRRRRV